MSEKYRGMTAEQWHQEYELCHSDWAKMRDCTEAVKQRAEAAEADAKEWRERFQQCSTERQELEAQVAALREAANGLLEWDLRGVLDWECCDSKEVLKSAQVLREAYENTAATAAQRDARVKAEALREAITDLCGNAHRSPIEVLRDRAAEIEKGAEL